VSSAGRGVLPEGIGKNHVRWGDKKEAGESRQAERGGWERGLEDDVNITGILEHAEHDPPEIRAGKSRRGIGKTRESRKVCDRKGPDLVFQGQVNSENRGIQNLSSIRLAWLTNLHQLDRKQKPRGAAEAASIAEQALPKRRKVLLAHRNRTQHYQGKHFGNKSVILRHRVEPGSA